MTRYTSEDIIEAEERGVVNGVVLTLFLVALAAVLLFAVFSPIDGICLK